MKTHSEIMYTDIYILTNLDVVYALMFLLIDVFGGPEKGLLCWMANACLSLGLLGLLGEEDGLDVGQDTSLGDGDTGQKLVQLLVVTDGERLFKPWTSQTSWGGGRPGCWAGHLPGRW